jgi:hypothetical protein
VVRAREELGAAPFAVVVIILVIGDALLVSLAPRAAHVELPEHHVARALSSWSSISESDSSSNASRRHNAKAEPDAAEHAMLLSAPLPDTQRRRRGLRRDLLAQRRVADPGHQVFERPVRPRPCR